MHNIKVVPHAVMPELGNIIEIYDQHNNKVGSVFPTENGIKILSMRLEETADRVITHTQLTDRQPLRSVEISFKKT